MLIKVCGIISPGTALTCIRMGISMIGLVYYPPSPRHLAIAQIREILDAVEPLKKIWQRTTLVVVDQLPDEKIVSRFDYLQPYGNMQDYVPPLPTQMIPVVKDSETLTRLLEAPITAGQVPLHTLEMSEGLMPGGNGASWDWSLARPFCERYPTLIAGGITPENVGEVIRQASPYGIDVSSGVESAPGVKDIDKIKRLIENVHQAIISGE